MIFDEEKTPVVAFFQPIVAADSGAICAYEVLGRYFDENGEVKSLGPFFENPATSPEAALQVDRRVRRDAMVKFSHTEMNTGLFINIRLHWLRAFADHTEELPTLHWARELNISPERIVIEITEHEFSEDNAAFQRVIEYYRSQGCRIAIDDYGKGASNLDRLAKILPDIIKINMEYVQHSEQSYFYEEYLRMLAVFAERIGCEVLFEGVETDRQLQICLAACGRYYQGFRLAKPQPDLATASADLACFKKIENEILDDTDQQASRLSEAVEKLKVWLNDFCGSHYPATADDVAPYAIEDFNGLNEFLRQLCLSAPTEFRRRIIRAYLCSPAGDQLSANVEPTGKTDDAPIIRDDDSTPRNWGWRPYFRAAKRFFAFGHRCFVSDRYRDLQGKGTVHTLIYLTSAQTYVLVDVSEM